MEHRSGGVMNSDDASARQHAHTPPRHTVEVAAGLIFRDGKLLITQRRADAHLGGLWEFPGGKREPGETFEDCLRRELREELDCVVHVGELLESVEHAYPAKTVQLRFFRCSWVAREPRAVGCAALRWIGRDELEYFSFPEADRVLVARLQRDEHWWRPRARDSGLT